MNVKEKVISIIAGVLEVEPSKITLESSIGDFQKWDSLGNLTILQQIQDEFDFELDPDEIIDLEDVNDIINIVEEKIQK
jgi:acyl carrier protein